MRVVLYRLSAIGRFESSSGPASLDLALAWHRAIYNGVRVSDTDDVGAIRDSDPAHPCLIDYEVVVGAAPGALARDVPAALDAYVPVVQQVVGTPRSRRGTRINTDRRAVIMAIVRLCAYAHGEWIRIHPIAKGHGRTARVWANWIAMRYGLPPFIRIKPRLDDALFVRTAVMSMRGDHRAAEVLFVALLNDALAARQP